MDKNQFINVVETAAKEKSCTVVDILYNDDDNVFEVIIDKDGDVALDDCEYIHRAVLNAFDRNIEDYSLTVGSKGIDAAEADLLLVEK